MENLNSEEDPVIQEIRAIREKIAKITEGFSDEKLLAWYRAEAQKALRYASSHKEEVNPEPRD